MSDNSRSVRSVVMSKMRSSAQRKSDEVIVMAEAIAAYARSGATRPKGRSRYSQVAKRTSAYPTKANPPLTKNWPRFFMSRTLKIPNAPAKNVAMVYSRSSPSICPPVRARTSVPVRAMRELKTMVRRQ
jgi:hypothetical protein